MPFPEEFQNLFIDCLDQVESGKPRFIFIEKEPGASILPVMEALGIAERSGISTWSAYCGDRSAPLFEQLLPVLAFANQHLDISVHFFKRLLYKQGIYSTARVREPILPFDPIHERVAEQLIEKTIALCGQVRDSA